MPWHFTHTAFPSGFTGRLRKTGLKELVSGCDEAIPRIGHIRQETSAAPREISRREDQDPLAIYRFITRVAISSRVMPISARAASLITL